MKTICSWCTRVMANPDAVGLVTHGCCKRCMAALWAEPVAIPEVEQFIEERQRQR